MFHILDIVTTCRLKKPPCKNLSWKKTFKMKARSPILVKEEKAILNSTPPQLFFHGLCLVCRVTLFFVTFLCGCHRA